MIPVFADAFFFFALLNEKDAAHEAAETYRSRANRPLVTTAWVLTEVADGCALPDRCAMFFAIAGSASANARRQNHSGFRRIV
jgi:predicted nucleic acid-binding protein